jgi:hypothetical protein
MNRNRYAIVFGLLVWLAAGARLSALSFSETTLVPPDFPGGISFGFGSVLVGTLDPGANTVSGSLAGTCNVGDCNPGGLHGDTQDSFNIMVPAGYHITSFTVTTSSVAGPTGFSATTSVDVPAFPGPAATLIPTSFLVLNGTTGNLVTSPIGPGEYAVSVFGQGATAAGSFSLSWSVTMNLAPLVVSPAQAVTDLINLISNPLSGLVLTTGQTNSLTDKLNNALTSILAGQNKQAINQLQAFINSVQTDLKTGKISAPTATTLTVAANAIITSLQ